MMTFVFALWGVLTASAGVLLLAMATSALHEIEAGIAFIVSTISFVGAALVHGLRAAKGTSPP